MTTDRPSMSELRARVFKHSGTGRTEGGTWLARRVGRPSATYGTWMAVRMGASADAVTLAALAAGIGGAIGIGTGTRAGFAAGVALLGASYWLDHVDGQVARWRRTASVSGVYFDYLMHHASAMALGFALGFGLAARGGAVGWSAAGFLIAAGWSGLSLHNDCRYKAFFTKLMREGRAMEYRPAGRPSIRPGRRSAAWPLSKACEPHVVLMTLAPLAVAAIARPTSWVAAWKTYVVVMAIVAPTLAAGRAARAILGRAPDREFDGLFPAPPARAGARRGGGVPPSDSSKAQ